MIALNCKKYRNIRNVSSFTSLAQASDWPNKKWRSGLLVQYAIFPERYGSIGFSHLETVTSPSERCDYPCRCYIYSPHGVFCLCSSSKFKAKEEGQITMELMEIEDNNFLGSPSVNHPTSAIFNPWETHKMKRQNVLILEAKVSTMEVSQASGLILYPVNCEGPFFCLLISFLVLSSIHSDCLSIRKMWLYFSMKEWNEFIYFHQ